VNPHGTSFAGRVGWGTRPAVVVVDLVRAYTEPGGPFFLGGEDPATPGRVLEACAALVGAARPVGVPVVWTVVRYAPDLADAGFFATKVPALACFAEGADGGWGEPALAPAADDTLLVKQHASAFAGTSLAATLRSPGRGHRRRRRRLDLRLRARHRDRRARRGVPPGRRRGGLR
jgi:maleamate amidohydrolase